MYELCSHIKDFSGLSGILYDIKIQSTVYVVQRLRGWAVSRVLDVLIRIQLFLILCSNPGFDLVGKHFPVDLQLNMVMIFFIIIIILNFLFSLLSFFKNPLHFLNLPGSNLVEIVVSSYKDVFPVCLLCH